jgi:hypothetical protein
VVVGEGGGEACLSVFIHATADQIGPRIRQLNCLDFTSLDPMWNLSGTGHRSLRPQIYVHARSSRRSPNIWKLKTLRCCDHVSTYVVHLSKSFLPPGFAARLCWVLFVL